MFGNIYINNWCTIEENKTVFFSFFLSCRFVNRYKLLYDKQVSEYKNILFSSNINAVFLVLPVLPKYVHSVDNQIYNAFDNPSAKLRQIRMTGSYSIPSFVCLSLTLIRLRIQIPISNLFFFYIDCSFTFICKETKYARIYHDKAIILNFVIYRKITIKRFCCMFAFTYSL